MNGSRTHVPAHQVTERTVWCTEFDEFLPAERDAMHSVMSAVVSELGIAPASKAERRAIASSIATSWKGGARMPLNLVHAGLQAAGV